MITVYVDTWVDSATPVVCARTSYEHRTLKSAFRRLGSCITGKLAREHADAHAFYIRTNDGRYLSWTEARNIIEHGAL